MHNIIIKKIDVAIQSLTRNQPKQTWFDSNKLTLNINKPWMLRLYRTINFNSQGEDILGNKGIQRVTQEKSLGVIVDLHLNW